MGGYALGADICPHCGCEIAPPEVTRSPASNRYYWAILHQIAEDVGERAEDLHTAFKDKFLGRENLELGMRFVPSSKHMSQQAFSEYVEQIRAWSHYYRNVYIDTPEEYFAKRLVA